MIDRGANPFVVDYTDGTRFENVNLDYLSNLPTQKSVYFTTRQLDDEFEANPDFFDPWFYQTGVFDGEFNSVIGRGSTGTVIRGQWCGKKAAFKFVKIENEMRQKDISDTVKSLNQKLSEMASIQATNGSKIVSFYGHYR